MILTVKPLILAFESSHNICAASLTLENELICQYSINIGNVHDRLLAEFVRRIFNDTSIDIQTLSAVAVSSGPGSFTGLRIAASIAKGICFESNIKLISSPTLSALAYFTAKFTSNHPKRIVACVPSNRDLIYYQLFNSDAQPYSDIIFDKESVLNELNSEETVFCGPAANFISEKHKIINLELSASFISEYAYKQYLDNDFVDAENFVPLYIQEFEPKSKTKK